MGGWLDSNQRTCRLDVLIPKDRVDQAGMFFLFPKKSALPLGHIPHTGPLLWVFPATRANVTASLLTSSGGEI